MSAALAAMSSRIRTARRDRQATGARPGQDPPGPAAERRAGRRRRRGRAADTLDAVDQLAVDARVLAFDGDAARGCAPAGRPWPQPAGGLDVRAGRGVRRPSRRGPAVLVGMDTPQLRPEQLAAFDPARYDACLGPAPDGGYWAIGFADPAPGRGGDRAACRCRRRTPAPTSSARLQRARPAGAAARRADRRRHHRDRRRRRRAGPATRASPPRSSRPAPPSPWASDGGRRARAVRAGAARRPAARAAHRRRPGSSSSTSPAGWRAVDGADEHRARPLPRPGARRRLRAGPVRVVAERDAASPRSASTSPRPRSRSPAARACRRCCATSSHDLPGEGRWPTVLLMDGNIGIGGDPARLLAARGRLLAPGGRLIVEAHPDDAAHDLLEVRFTVAGEAVGPSFGWAHVGRAAAAALRRRGRLRARRSPGRRAAGRSSRSPADGRAPPARRRAAPRRRRRSPSRMRQVGGEVLLAGSP